VAYGTDTRRVVKLLEEVGRSVQDVSKFPTRPKGLFRGFGDSALNFELRVILRDVNTMLDTETEIHHKIAEVFAREKIEIPFVQRDLWIRNPEALHPRSVVEPLSE
jgi:small-conductance mechanosensitive channel